MRDELNRNRTEARCPNCNKWSEVIDVLDETFPYEMWVWRINETAECPYCGYVVLFESECDFRYGADND
jgi:DNA-directed RNA polymerase subunit RPC12/RpoP